MFSFFGGWDPPGCTFLFGNEDAAKQDICKCGLFKMKGEEGEEV